MIHNLAPPTLKGYLAHNEGAGMTRPARGDLVPKPLVKQLFWLE